MDGISVTYFLLDMFGPVAKWELDIHWYIFMTSWQSLNTGVIFITC